MPKKSSVLHFQFKKKMQKQIRTKNVKHVRLFKLLYTSKFGTFDQQLVEVVSIVFVFWQAPIGNILLGWDTHTKRCCKNGSMHRGAFRLVHKWTIWPPERFSILLCAQELLQSRFIKLTVKRSHHKRSDPFQLCAFRVLLGVAYNLRVLPEL